MSAMTKRVNIDAPIAVRNITPPIYGVHKNIIMSTGDILKCLCRRAKVDEILPDGSTIHLTMRNYYTDNGAGLDAEKITPVVVEKEDESVNVSKDTSDGENTTIIANENTDEPNIDDIVDITTNEDVVGEVICNNPSDDSISITDETNTDNSDNHNDIEKEDESVNVSKDTSDGKNTTIIANENTDEPNIDDASNNDDKSDIVEIIDNTAKEEASVNKTQTTKKKKNTNSKKK